LDRGQQPGRRRGPAEQQQVLRLLLLLQPPWEDHRPGLGQRGRGAGGRPRPRRDPRGAQHLAVLPGPPTRDLQRACGAASMTTLIKNGTVVTATDMTPADVLIDGERIQAIGVGLGDAVTADTVIDATGRYVMPGGIDVHTHMELPFGGTFASDDFA